MDCYRYENGAYYLYRETSKGPELVHSMPAMKDGSALGPGEEPSQIDPSEKPMPTTHQRIAIAYFKKDKTLATHGDAGNMKVWVESHNKVAGAEHGAALHVFKDGAPADDINRALRDPAYLALLVQ